MHKIAFMPFLLLCACMVKGQLRDYDLIPFLKASGKWTFAHAATKEIAMKKEFQEVQLFVNGTSIVAENRKYGVIDKQGNVLIPLQYKDLYRHGEKFISYSNALGQKAGDYKAYQLFPGGKEKLIVHFAENTEENRFTFFSNKKTGFVDKNLKVVIPAVFDVANGFNGHYAVVYKGLHCGLIDTTGRFVIPPEYNEIRYAPGGKYIYAKNKQYKVGYLDINGNTLINFQYRSAQYHPKGDHFYVQDENEKYGVIDLSGKVLVPFVYDYVKTAKNNRLVLKKQNKFGMIDLGGKELLPFEYDTIWESEDDSVIVVSKNAKAGVISYDFKQLVPLEYESIGFPYSYKPEKNGLRLLIAQKNGKFGIINYAQQVKIAFEWDDIEVFDNNKGIFKVKKGNHYGMVNTKNEVLVPAKYKEIVSYENGWLCATNDFFETIYIDSQGREFVE